MLQGQQQDDPSQATRAGQSGQQGAALGSLQSAGSQPCPPHRPLDVSDGLSVHGRQLVDQLVVLRQEGQVEVQALLYCLLGPGRCHL